MELSNFQILIFLLLIPLVNSIDIKFVEKYSTRAHEISAQVNQLNAGWKVELHSTIFVLQIVFSFNALLLGRAPVSQLDSERD